MSTHSRIITPTFVRLEWHEEMEGYPVMMNYSSTPVLIAVFAFKDDADAYVAWRDSQSGAAL